MIEIKELNAVRRGPVWALEAVIEFDVIPGIPETIRVPIPIKNWRTVKKEELLDDIEERVQRAAYVLRTEIVPVLEMVKDEFFTKKKRKRKMKYRGKQDS